MHRKQLYSSFLAAIFISGCGAAPSRAKDPDRYTLVDSGVINPTSTMKLQECLLDAFSDLNSSNTAFSVIQTRRNEGNRIEVYVSRVNLAVSADVYDNGKTELRLAPDQFGMFKKEPLAYRACLSKFL
ncbi:MAG: hypothetical protein EOO81_06645 [Oxalobacteraceae bacterium]|nr:MAG: hypothetical protein EOO81_06645 [Oxalobacteraceae bacterium]